MVEFNGSITTANSGGHYGLGVSETADGYGVVSPSTTLRWDGLVPSEAVDTLAARFRRLRDTWLRETAYTNSMDVIVDNPAYQEIISIGPAIVPFILADLKERPRPWSAALHRITGADPVRRADAGDMRAIARAWLRWGEKQGVFSADV